MLEIPYVVDSSMVRGLDYHTIFEIMVADSALGRATLPAAGGRYNGLVQELGGPGFWSWLWLRCRAALVTIKRSTSSSLTS